MAGDIIILKFGSSVLRSRADLPAAVHEIYRWYRAGWRVAVIVSALGNTTDELRAEAHALAGAPQAHAMAELLATGERHCAALLGIALDRTGIPSRVVDPREIRLSVMGDVLDSEPVALDREGMRALFRAYPIIIVPGFFGYTTDDRLHLLGRGGSDLSAVFLASALHANRCRLIKDVDGVYEGDPALPSSTALRRFRAVGYAETLECAAHLVQAKAVRFLERHSAGAEVAGLLSPYESVIGRFQRDLAVSSPMRPLSVLLLGCGTVGVGLYQRIAAMPEHFRLHGVLVRDRHKHAAQGIPPEVLCESPDEIVNLPADAAIDLLPGIEPSQSLAHGLLARGVSFVSANKTLIADAGVELSALALRQGASFYYSAAVGGSAPMLEAIRREVRGEISAIAGVVNSTCNYVLDRCAEGQLLSEAVRAAREHGFAEADASEDLSGRDAARKLRILARHAFGRDIGTLDVEPLSSSALFRRRAALRPNETLRLVARAWKASESVFGKIQLEVVDASNPFAQTHSEWNRLVVCCKNGEEVVVCGRGAGCWPTTEAVIADLLELRFAQLGRDSSAPARVE